MLFTTSSSRRDRTDGVSVVVPVRNGERWLGAVLDAILTQRGRRRFEVIVVDDGSQDGSRALLEARYPSPDVRVIDGPRRGAAAALNTGIRSARFPFIAQIDQDVVVAAGWLDTLLAAMADDDVGAAQGYYETDRQAPLTARVMGLDLEQRYAAISGSETDHVCTGNVVYRAEALHAVGLFDENLGYGYDNDMSYRLARHGYRLRLCRDARSRHHWRSGLLPYLVQQYGFGYGRVDVVVRHRSRFTGDAVSPADMMLHPLLMLVAVSVMVVGMLSGHLLAALAIAGLLVSGLVFERLIAGCRAAFVYRDAAPLAFPVLHIARDATWAAAIVVWCVRRIASTPTQPAFSMRPRPDEITDRARRQGAPSLSGGGLRIED
jgi:glycosyltransferase involved in cell wall biosynthesis